MFWFSPHSLGIIMNQVSNIINLFSDVYCSSDMEFAKIHSEPLRRIINGINVFCSGFLYHLSLVISATLKNKARFRVFQPFLVNNHLYHPYHYHNTWKRQWIGPLPVYHLRCQQPPTVHHLCLNTRWRACQLLTIILVSRTGDAGWTERATQKMRIWKDCHKLQGQVDRGNRGRMSVLHSFSQQICISLGYHIYTY